MSDQRVEIERVPVPVQAPGLDWTYQLLLKLIERVEAESEPCAASDC